jgi:hypothetical protein
VYLIAMYWPFAGRFFQLTALDGPAWLRVLAVAVPAYLLSLLSDRLRLDAPERKEAESAAAPSAGGQV